MGNYKFFTKEEDQLILDNYQTMGSRITDLFPNRSKASVMGRANKLGVHISKTVSDWTNEEEDILRKHYPKIGVKVIDMLPNRSEYAIKNRASVLKIKGPSAWTKEEDYQIRKHNMEISKELMELLPGRSEGAIRIRIKQLQTAKLTSNKDKYTYMSYPLNIYILVFGTHKGYDKIYPEFDSIITKHLDAIIKHNPDKIDYATKMVEAFDLRFKKHLPAYDISRELNISEDMVNKLCVQCINIFKRTMVKH